MPFNTASRDLAFLLHDVGRLLRTRADQAVSDLGMTRAQWAVLARVEKCQGLKQSELADILDLQPISLTRLIDRLCDSGLMERRSDASDRRAKRLFLTPAAQPVLERLSAVGEHIMEEVLAGTDPAAIAQARAQLTIMKDNLRAAIQNGPAPDKDLEQRYG